MKKFLYDYAKLIVGYGIKLKKGENVIISFDEYGLELAREVAKVSYEFGAKDVKLNFSDVKFSDLRYLYGSEEAYSSVAEFDADYENTLIDNKYHRIRLTDFREPNQDVDIKKSGIYKSKQSKLMKKVSDRLMSDELKWTIVPVVSDDWAKLVYPNMEIKEAKHKLWQDIFYIVRLDRENPIKEWEEHNEKLKNRINTLDKMDILKLHFIGDGTDITIHLADGAVWCGGEDISKSGDKFMANIPTEEVYSMPHKYMVDGYVRVTKPFVVYGKRIDKLSMTFERGRLISFNADKNEDVFEKLISTDEGAKHLGEVALVDKSSPINNYDFTFFECLIDENAACHIALGASYPATTNALGDKEKIGQNESSIHEDLMIGSDSMKIVATTRNGEEIVIMENGSLLI